MLMGDSLFLSVDERARPAYEPAKPAVKRRRAVPI